MSTAKGFAQIGAENHDQLKKADDISYTNLVASVRATFNTNKTKDLAWRKQQLNQLKKMIQENYERITEAVLKDHSGPRIRGLFDMSSSLSDIALQMANIDKWSSDEAVSHDWMLGKSYVRKEPKGVVLLIAPWNFPFAMVTDPLVPIISAGNCAVIKPSEVSANSCALIAELIPKYLDTDAFKVVTGGIPETTAILREKFDHIMYTGNGAVGRIVMTAAAKHLTPVTLELGGKSPVYVDKSARLGVAVARVAQYKWMNVGQICVAPDYVLVHEEVADEFKKSIVQTIKSSFGETVEDRMKNPAFARIINSRHVERISGLLSKTSGKILIGGENKASDHFFDATILENPDLEDVILQEEIFGPVLPIVTVKSVEEAAQKVNKICNKPLALYVFAEDQKAIDTFLHNTSSGGVAVNTTLDHLSNTNLPFGGVGESGMGHYHGKWGFDEFSHHRAVYVKDTLLNRQPTLPPPPYPDKMYDIMAKYLITGFVSEGQKKILKLAGAGIVAAAGAAYIHSKL